MVAPFERLALIVAPFVLPLSVFSSFHLYQECPFRTFYDLDNLSIVWKAPKREVEKGLTITANAPPPLFIHLRSRVSSGGHRR